MTALPEDVVANLSRENARLQAELRAAQDRQTATAEILKVIASSPSDVQPVFEAIADSAKRLIGGFSTTVLRFIGDELHLAAYTPTNAAADDALKASFSRRLEEFPTFALVRDGETVQFADTESEEVPAANRELGRLRGFRSVLFTPLMNRGTPVGMISVTRADPGAFAAHHIQLLQTFADQAVIAIENVRLFNETREALEQQKASADILRAISSSVADTQPAFDKILDSCKHLFGSDETAVLLVDDEDLVTLGAYVGKQHDAVAATFPAPVDKSPAGHAIRERRVVHYTDAANHAQLTRAVRHVAQVAGYEAMAYAPMMWNERGIGAIGVSRLKGAFSDKELALLQTFADQAVIAIQNARLFNEVQARTSDLSEALTYQTGSGKILSVIASSPTDVAPTLNAIVESACELCGAYDAVVLLKDGEDLRFDAHHGPIPMRLEKWPINRNWIAGRAFLDRKPVHVHDLLSSEGDDFPDGREMSRRMGLRSILGVPLTHEN
ncbi:MAG TPA: GAF domain-containing protein, partial [Bradyrhizobium sp.]|nr:GAF domain-containing protein [Bradyrhizobium sp.]